MAKGVKDRITPAGKQFFAEMQKLADFKVMTGFTADKKGYNQNHGSVDAEDYDDGTTIVEVAVWNEFGTKNSDGSQRIPERPFMRQTVEKHSDKVMKMAVKQVEAVAAGKADADKAMRAVGALQVGLIQNEIRSGGFVKNADSTLAQKDSSQPLIDTARMRQSVHYVIKPREG